MLGISTWYIDGVTNRISRASLHWFCTFHNNNDQNSRKIRQAQDQWYIPVQGMIHIQGISAMNEVGKHALLWKESQNVL